MRPGCPAHALVAAGVGRLASLGTAEKHGTPRAVENHIAGSQLLSILLPAIAIGATRMSATARACSLGCYLSHSSMQTRDSMPTGWPSSAAVPFCQPVSALQDSGNECEASETV